jgi:hypothetical protein
MENFSTPQRATLPWIANLATLAVVVAAIGWSGVQRPDEAAAATAVAVPAAAQTAPVVDRGEAPQTGATQGRWPAKTTMRAVEGLQTVGYSPQQSP